MAPSDESERDDDLALPEDDVLDAGEGLADAVAEGAETEEKPKLDLEIQIDRRGACERHITVSVPREDISRYFDKEFSELMPTAQVPGFRPGRAPRKLVESRFRKDVAEKVKNLLLMDSLSQISEEQDLSAISEPEFDLEAVDLPKDGPMTFEFDLEVRPEFDLPKWKGLSLERPVREFSDADVEAALKDLLARHGQLVPKDGPAELGDYVTTNLIFRHGDQALSRAEEEVIRIRPVLSFRDGNIWGFDKLMAGVWPGQTRVGEAELTMDAPNVALRGKKIQATFEVLEVKRLELPELTPQFLAMIGDFGSEADLRDAVRDNLKRQLEYQQRRHARQQITAVLTVAANWELPPALLRRQSARELERAVMELQSSGFSQAEIRARENQLRQNILDATARALKEHFILERIAEEEEIGEDEADYETEIRLIAAQSGETPRRVRARLEKSGRWDVLRNQIVERKVIDLILANAQFKEVPYEPETTVAEAVDRAAGGGEAEIPEAKPEQAPESAEQPQQENPQA